MRWAAVAPFFDATGGGWLGPFVDRSRHEIRNVPMPGGPAADWHTTARGVTEVGDWMAAARHVERAWRSGADGLITLFPQRAVIAGARRSVALRDRPIVAWCVNIGRLYGGARRLLARHGLSRVDLMVVHSRRECRNYSEWLDLPPERFEFVPLQHGAVAATLEEERSSPFLASIGSAHRDFPTLFEAVRPLGLRTIVVTSPRNLRGLDVPACVEVRTGLGPEQCLELAQRARLSVVPIANDATASGQVTVIEAMWLGRPVVATRCVGTEDYIEPGVTGDLVPLGDPPALREAIARLWDDEALRLRIGRAARGRRSHATATRPPAPR